MFSGFLDSFSALSSSLIASNISEYRNVLPLCSASLPEVLSMHSLASGELGEQSRLSRGETPDVSVGSTAFEQDTVFTQMWQLLGYNGLLITEALIACVAGCSLTPLPLRYFPFVKQCCL